MTHRMSALPIVQYCAPAGALSQMGAGRAAAQSTAFHALCCKAPNATELCTLLSEDEYQEILTWKAPGDVDLGKGVVLRYADAMKEFEVALNASGEYVPIDSPDAIVTGHPDMAWVVETPGMKIAYVGDIKRSEWTVSTGVESLQLHGYGLAVAGKFGCDAYAVGLWGAIEGRWQWSDLIDLFDAGSIAQKVVAAAMNQSTEYNMGPHCRSCYGRLRCPAWLLPPELSNSKLAPLAQGGGELTQENAHELLLLVQRFDDAAGAVKEALKAYAIQHGGIRDPKTGKVWRATICEGRESVSVATVRKVLGPDADKVIKQGKPYERFVWTTP